jgi:hypothetical protein
MTPTAALLISMSMLLSGQLRLQQGLCLQNRLER